MDLLNGRVAVIAVLSGFSVMSHPRECRSGRFGPLVLRHNPDAGHGAGQG